MIMMKKIVRDILFVALTASSASAFTPLQKENRIAPGNDGGVLIPSLRASILDTTTSANDDLPTDPLQLWQTLEEVALAHQHEKGRIMFHEKELALQNEELSLQLQHQVNFHVPSTWEEATTQFWSQPQTQVLGSALLLSLMFRLTIPSFGVADLAAMFLTKWGWELQEWAYHYRNFHGNANGKSHFPFDYHNQHHDLPYYHLAMEPTSVCACFALSVTGLALAIGTWFGGPDEGLPVVATTHASFLASSIYYLWVHYLAHSKVPLKGDLQAARLHHIQHHLNHEVNLNMASHTIDTWIGTVPVPVPPRDE